MRNNERSTAVTAIDLKQKQKLNVSGLSSAFSSPVRSSQGVTYCRRHLVLKQFPLLPPLDSPSFLYTRELFLLCAIISEPSILRPPCFIPTQPPFGPCPKTRSHNNTKCSLWIFTPLYVNSDKMQRYSFEGKPVTMLKVSLMKYALCCRLLIQHKHYLPCRHNTLYWLWIVRRW